MSVLIAEIMSAFQQSGFFFSHGVHCCDYCNYNDSNNNCDFSICCRTFTGRCQSEVMGKSSTCHQTENGHSGVCISLACKDQLTKRASTEENTSKACQIHSQCVPQSVCMCDRLSRKSRIEIGCSCNCTEDQIHYQCCHKNCGKTEQ